MTDHVELPRGVMAVVRTRTAGEALTLGRALAGTTVAGIEITMTVPDAPSVIATLTAEGVARVGAGTVRTADQVRACAAAGARFVVSPHLDPDVVKATVDHGLVSVPGALTPSEMIAAVRAGAHMVKIFPIGAVGGTDYVTSVLEPLPDLRVVVSGGVEPAAVSSYRAAGADVVCLGSSLWRHGDVLAGDVEAVRRHAAQVLRQAGL